MLRLLHECILLVLTEHKTEANAVFCLKSQALESFSKITPTSAAMMATVKL